MNIKIVKAIKKAKEYIRQMANVGHDESHMKSVINYAMKIAAVEKNVDSDVLELAIWWHDVGRLHRDDGHPQKSAEMAREYLQANDFDADFIEKICDAIENHGSKAGADLPTTLEGKILRDADKLDFLTPARWKVTIQNKKIATIKAAIKKIPIIRNQILFFDKSKEIFDEVAVKLKNYILTVNDDFFAEYKKQLLREL